MACKSCQSENQRKLYGELAIHFPGLDGLTKPARLGVSKAYGLLGLWRHGVHYSNA